LQLLDIVTKTVPTFWQFSALKGLSSKMKEGIKVVSIERSF